MKFFFSPDAKRDRDASFIGGDIYNNPSDDETPDEIIRGFIVHSAGAVEITTANEDEIDWADGDLVLGVIYPFEVKTLRATTTAKVTLCK